MSEYNSNIILENKPEFTKYIEELSTKNIDTKIDELTENEQKISEQEKKLTSGQDIEKDLLMKEKQKLMNEKQILMDDKTILVEEKNKLDEFYDKNNNVNNNNSYVEFMNLELSLINNDYDPVILKKLYYFLTKKYNEIYPNINDETKKIQFNKKYKDLEYSIVEYNTAKISNKQLNVQNILKYILGNWETDFKINYSEEINKGGKYRRKSRVQKTAKKAKKAKKSKKTARRRRK